jgi:hypothetical protein
VRLEGLGQLKKSTSSGLGTYDPPDCSIVPQPTTLPRAPEICHKYILKHGISGAVTNTPRGVGFRRLTYTYISSARTWNSTKIRFTIYETCLYEKLIYGLMQRNFIIDQYGRKSHLADDI